MVRLDKFLCDCNIGTRSQVKDYIRLGQVTVNGTVIKKSDVKIDENSDNITFRGSICTCRRFAYYMLNKPAGVVSATADNTADTVLSLLKEVKDKNLFPVGRLDKDTTGLLLITNDGDMAHRMLSPRRHVVKTYLAGIREPLTVEAKNQLEQGVDIGDEDLTFPARVSIPAADEGISEIDLQSNTPQILLTIHEGRFHQVKRMLQAVGNEVVTLKRISFGPLTLDNRLAPGEYRELTQKEVEACTKC